MAANFILYSNRSRDGYRYKPPTNTLESDNTKIYI